MNTKKNVYFITLLSILFVSSTSYVQAESLTAEQKLVLNSMSVDELKDRKISVENAIVQIEDEMENTQNPSTTKALSSSLNLLDEELVYIVALLLASSAIISDGGSVDDIPPAITILGDNPATVELGDYYTDAGATATDLSGAVTVVTTGTVDTDTVGAYTITYTSTDASGNAGTATRTVNVVDTTKPVVTSYW